MVFYISPKPTIYKVITGFNDIGGDDRSRTGVLPSNNNTNVSQVYLVIHN